MRSARVLTTAQDQHRIERRQDRAGHVLQAKGSNGRDLLSLAGNQAADQIAVAAEVFGCRMHHHDRRPG